MKNKVIFSGVGPGAADLMTVRCLNAIKNAEVIIYAGSLISSDVIELFDKNTKIFDSAGLTLNEIVSIIKENYSLGKKVLRLHSGDPSMYGAIIEQFNQLDSAGIEYEVIPGVSSVFASAAALKTELTLPTVSQTVILTRAPGRTPVPENETLDKLASHQATMAIFLSIQNINIVVKQLISGGYSPGTPIAVVYRATWPDEKIIRGTLENIAGIVQKENIKNQGMIIVGDVLNREGELSGLYHAAFAHGFRDADANAKLPDYLSKSEDKTSKNELKENQKSSCAIYSLTENGLMISRKIARHLKNCHIFASDKHRDSNSAETIFFPPDEFSKTVKGYWNKYESHIFIMATGIVVRTIAPLLKSKLTDPAVVCCDDMENYAISLTSGHIGGANRLAETISEFTSYRPVITTASDTRCLNSIDEFSSQNKWIIENPEKIKFINSAFIEGKPVACFCRDIEVFELLKKHFPALVLCKDIETEKCKFIIAVDCDREVKTDRVVLWLKKS